jgi:hypothetical protein
MDVKMCADICPILISDVSSSYLQALAAISPDGGTAGDF